MSSKPTRDAETLLIRMPDGLKQRIAEHARANGRSMNADIVSTLATVVGQPDADGLQGLIDELQTIDAELDAANLRVEQLRERRGEIISLVTRRRRALGNE